MNFENELAKLAARIAKKATEADTSFAESVDAFKVLIAYYSALRKGNKASSDEQPDEPNFATFQNALEEHANGTQVRGGTGRTGRQ